MQFPLVLAGPAVRKRKQGALVEQAQSGFLSQPPGESVEEVRQPASAGPVEWELAVTSITQEAKEAIRPPTSQVREGEAVQHLWVMVEKANPG